jgi:hypothetical protein
MREELLIRYPHHTDHQICTAVTDGRINVNTLFGIIHYVLCLGVHVLPPCGGGGEHEVTLFLRSVTK